jgi:hypothetical protein
MAHERAFQLRCELLLSLSVNIRDAFSGEYEKGTNNVINARSLHVSFFCFVLKIL